MASSRISPDEANARILAGEPVIFIDARNPKAWSKSTGKIPGAIRMMADDVSRRFGELDREATIIAYCTCPNDGSSVRAARILTQHGFRAFVLRGGFEAWVAAEYPVEEKTKAA